MFLVDFHINPIRGSGLHVIKFSARETTIFIELFNLKVNVAICCRVSTTIVYQLANHVLHLVDIFSCAWCFIRFKTAKAMRIFIHGLNKTVGQSTDCFAIFVGTFDNLVINISNITYVFDFPTLTAQKRII